MGYVLLVKLHKSSSPLKVYFAVGIGGIIGTTLRYALSLLLYTEDLSTFPWATFIVNSTGAFFLTFLLFSPFLQQKIRQTILIALTTGVIGSYTTFSAITIEVLTVGQENKTIALFYLLSTIIGGLLFSFGGFKAAQYGGKDEFIQ